MKKVFIILSLLMVGFLFAADFNVEIAVAGIVPANKDVIEIVEEIKTAGDNYSAIKNFQFMEVQKVEYENVDVDTTAAGQTMLSSVIFRFEFQMETSNYTLANLTTIVTAVKSKFYQVGFFDPAIQLKSQLYLEGNFNGRQ